MGATRVRPQEGLFEDFFKELRDKKYKNCIIDFSDYKFNREAFSYLLDCLEQHPEISGLDLSKTRIVFSDDIDDTDEIDEIDEFDEFDEFDEINEIDDTRFAIELLAEKFKLDTLILSENLLNDEHIKVLARNPYIRELDVSGNMIGIEGVKCLVQSRNLVNLNLSNNYININDECLKVLGKEGTLACLDLSGNHHITHEGIRYLVANDELSRLYLSHIKLSDKSIESLAESKIDFLILRQCAMDERKARALVRYDRFIGLDLGNDVSAMVSNNANTIGPQGVLAILNSKKLKDLRLNNLSLFHYASDSRVVVMDALAERALDLEELHFQDNGLNDEGIKAIALQIKYNFSNLRILSISDRTITDRGVRTLVDALADSLSKDRSQLHSLSLKFTKFLISVDNYDAIMQDLLEENALWKLDVESLKQSIDSLKALMLPLVSEEQHRADEKGATMALCYYFKSYLETQQKENTPIKNIVTTDVLDGVLKMIGAPVPKKKMAIF
jgi:Ran GTPase-activating protein (RanGAP) involved in mRNA processing and transport